MNISISTNKDLPWASAGHTVAFEQFFLPSLLPHSKDLQVRSTQPDTHSAGLKVTEEEDRITVAGGESALLFVLSKKTGDILHLGVEGKPSVVTSGGGPCTWRALTDNDGPSNESKLVIFCHIHAYTNLIPNMYFREWKNHRLDVSCHPQVTFFKTSKLKAEDHPKKCSGLAGEVVFIKLKTILPTETIAHNVTYIIDARGKVLMKNKLIPSTKLESLCTLPRLGISFTVPRRYGHLHWYGRGPGENYCDRKWGSLVGVYHETVENLLIPYIKPQSNGNRTGALLYIRS